EAILSDGRKALLFKIEQEPVKWNVYYVTPEGNGRWCFDKPVDNVAKWDIFAKIVEEDGYKHQRCFVIIEGERTDTTGKKDKVSFSLISAGGADLAKIKEGDKYRVYHVTAQGEKHDITEEADDIIWKMNINGAAFVKVKKGNQYKVYHVTARGEKHDITGLIDVSDSDWEKSINATFFDDGVSYWKMSINGAGFVKVEEGDKYRLYYVTAEGKGKDITGLVNALSDWEMSPNGAGFAKVKEGDKYRFYHVTERGKKQDITGLVNKVSDWKMNINGACCVKVQELVKKHVNLRVYHVTALGKKQDITALVNNDFDFIMSDTGAYFLKIKKAVIRKKHHAIDSRIDHITAQGKRTSVTGFVENIVDWQIGTNGGFVEVEEELRGKRKVYHVTAQGETKGITFEDKKEVILSDGHKAFLFKVEQEPGKWNFYYITSQGNGRWCLDKPLDNVEDWYISAREAGEKGDKYQICSVT
ncbi:MAG: hypothetical protein KAI72_02050, partial [Candidatus Pacebacteria bacterium]|nr:hypothetical protein [Candidatus Paceibacterota bacterium]